MIVRNTWVAQTFTPQTAHSIVRVDLKLRRVGTTLTPGTLEITATDGSGHPTGDPLTFVEFNPNTKIGTEYAWHTFQLPSYALTQGIKYAILLHIPYDGVANQLHWAADDTSPTYAYGCCEISYNKGGAWDTAAYSDLMFSEWAILPPIPPVKGLIHIRHPALLKVVHKRNGLLISGYDTLSSLNEEYLTGQVGVDVEVGDTIEATSLPGIKKAYLVR